MAGLHTVLPRLGRHRAWALGRTAFAEFRRRSLRAQAHAGRRRGLPPRRRHTISGTPHAVVAIVPAIACFEAAMLRRPRGLARRFYFRSWPPPLLAALIFHEVSGSILTVAWGLEGVALLAAGFALRDRVLRLSGLALLLVCTCKLFFWDLRNLDTLPRIFSFIVLGLLLVAVSWVYTRFRDQVRRML